jgi:D-aminopeptidase
MKILLDQRLDPLYEAVIEATEEAILNALTMAETMTGREGRVVHSLPLDRLQEVMARYRPGAAGSGARSRSDFGMDR